MITKTYIVALLVVGMALLSNSVVELESQRTEGTSVKLKTFLETSDELRNYSRNGYASTFTGEFGSIPENIQVELNRDLPEYRFHIARMSVQIDPPITKYDLILVTSAHTGEVQGFVWGHYWMMPPSESFGQLLKGYQARTKDEALIKVNSFAKLIAYGASAEASQATVGQGKVKVKLLRGHGVFGILEVQIDKRLRLGRLLITGPNGKKLRFFVDR